MAKLIQEWDGERPHILSAEKDGKDGVLVRFSDGTIAGYVAEELLGLRPMREKVEEPIERDEEPVLVPTKMRM